MRKGSKERISSEHQNWEAHETKSIKLIFDEMERASFSFLSIYLAFLECLFLPQKISRHTPSWAYTKKFGSVDILVYLTVSPGYFKRFCIFSLSHFHYYGLAFSMPCPTIPFTLPRFLNNQKDHNHYSLLYFSARTRASIERRKVWYPNKI